MHLNKIYTLILLLISLGCRDEKGWGNEGVGKTFTIKRQESFNYSEMLSGELDSTEKIELDNYKNRLIEKKENGLDKDTTNAAKEKNIIKEKFNSFLSVLYDLYINFIDLFN